MLIDLTSQQEEQQIIYANNCQEKNSSNGALHKVIYESGV